MRDPYTSRAEPASVSSDEQRWPRKGQLTLPLCPTRAFGYARCATCPALNDPPGPWPLDNDPEN